MDARIAIKFLGDLASEAHETSVAHGFWTCKNCGRTRPEHADLVSQARHDGEAFHELRCKGLNQELLPHTWEPQDRNIGEVIALMHSELTEALEDARSGKLLIEAEGGGLLRSCNIGKDKKPIEGLTEFADLLVRLGDWLGADSRRAPALATALTIKMQYNATRPFKHGREF